MHAPDIGHDASCPYVEQKHMREFEQIEDAVIAAFGAIPGLKTLDAYSGQLDVGEIDDITLQFPCVYVTANDLQVKTVNRYDNLAVEFSLIVGDRNVRGAKAAARGDASSPGVYELLHQCRSAIHRKVLVAGWTPSELIRVRPLVYAPKLNICLYEAVYRTQAQKLPNI